MTTTRTDPTREETMPAPEARVRIDPRIRERRIEVTRQAGRRRLRVLFVVCIVLSTVGLAFLAVISPVLDIDRVSITGAQHMTVAEVKQASGIHMHGHLLFVDTAAIARRIETLPWVQSATVHRDLPGTVSITIHEYVPSAYLRVPGGVMLVASNGHVIDQAAVPPAGTVQVIGIRMAPSAGELLAPPDAAGIVGRLPAALAQRVAAVDVSGTGVALDVTGNGQIRLGDTSDLDAKAASALAVMAHLGGAHFSYIDVSSPAHPSSHA